MSPGLKGVRGNALILVVLVLAALVAIAAPFALSMRLQEKTARGFAASLRAEQAARAARDLAVLRLLEGHPANERRAAEKAQVLADSPEDWDDLDEFAVKLEDLPGASAFEVRDPKGTILAAEIADDQGRANLNSASALLLGNILGVAELAGDLDESAREIAIDGDVPFYSDGNPETYDGVLRVGRELIVYKHIEGNVIRGCERGAFFSAPASEDLLHRKGDLVHDARGLKLAEHPFWAEIGGYRPYVTVSGAREIAGWQLVDLELADLIRRGITPEVLAGYGLGGESLRAAGAGRVLDRAMRRAALAASAPQAGAAPGGPGAVSATASAGDAAAAAEAEMQRMAERAAAGHVEAAALVDRALRRLGRKDGKAWLERVLGAVGSVKGRDTASFLEAAKARVRQIEDYERGYFPSVAEQVRRLADARDIEALSARELEAIRDVVTVSSTRPGEWAGGALVLNRVEFDPKAHVTRLVLGVDIPEAAAGAAARIEAPGGEVLYRQIAQSARGAGGRPSVIVVFPEIEGDYEKETLRVFVAPAHPVNVNTAPIRLLEALLTGLEARAVSQGRDVETDFVTRKEAEAVAQRIAAAPLKDVGDLVRVLDDAMAAGEISDSDRFAIFTNAIDPGNPRLRTHTVPFAFRGGEVATIVATGIVNDRAGNEIGRHVIRETVALAPPRETTVRLDSQADFFAGYPGEVSVPGRRANLVETLPHGLLGAGPLDSIPQLSRSHEPGVGEMRLAHGEAPGKDGWEGESAVEHFRDRPEGLKIEAGNARVETTKPIFASVPYFSDGLLPGHFELWFQPGWTDGFHVFFDTGPEADTQNRLACTYDGDAREIVLEVADAALDQIEPGYVGQGPRSAMFRAPFQFVKDRWYHLAAAWRGSKNGDLALFVDGLPLPGKQRGVTRLAQDIGIDADRIPVEEDVGFPLRGVVLVGTEAIDYDNAKGAWRDRGAAGTVLYAKVVDVTDKQTGETTRRRVSRAGSPRAHERGTPVEIFGYTDFLAVNPFQKPPRIERVPPGAAYNAEELKFPTPKALVYPDPDERLKAASPLGAGNLGFDAAATTIRVLSDDTFPPKDGVIQIGRERIKYAAADPPAKPALFTGLTRGFDGTAAEDHLALENVILCDLPVTPNTAAFDPDTTVQISIPSDPPEGIDPQPEWLRVVKPTDATVVDRFYLRHGDTRRGQPGSGSKVGEGVPWPTPAEYRARPEYQQWLRDEPSRARGTSGTTGRAHPAGEKLIGTFATQWRLAGRLDWVTITETDQTTRIERRIAWSSGNRVAFTDFVPREYSRSRGARLIKRPSGELPTQVSPAFSIGARRPDATQPGPPGWLDGRIDEPRLALDSTPFGGEFAWSNREAYGARVALGVPYLTFAAPLPAGASQGFDLKIPSRRLGPGAAGLRVPDPDSLRSGLLEGASTHGLLLKVDDEVFGCTLANGGLLTAGARGLLGTVPADHAEETPPYFLPFPAIARLAGGLAGPAGADIPITGVRPAAGVPPGPAYLALDHEGGRGIAEFLPYDRYEKELFRRPLDDRRRGACRGAFGTEKTTPLGRGALAFLFPFRFHDRFEPELESDDGVFWQGTVAPAGAGAGSACLFRAVEWDEDLPDGDVDVVLFARIDGKPAWDTGPTNAPGGIYRFDDPRAENRINVAGRSLEVRLVFPFKPGAYGRGTWKGTPRVGAVRVRYLEPVRVLAREELGR